MGMMLIRVYYESIKREPKIRGAVLVYYESIKREPKIKCLVSCFFLFFFLSLRRIFFEGTDFLRTYFTHCVIFMFTNLTTLHRTRVTVSVPAIRLGRKVVRFENS